MCNLNCEQIVNAMFYFFLECPRLRSASYSRLAAINVVIATHQEAYLYNFPVENGETVSIYKLEMNAILCILMNIQGVSKFPEKLLFHKIVHGPIKTLFNT